MTLLLFSTGAGRVYLQAVELTLHKPFNRAILIKNESCSLTWLNVYGIYKAPASYISIFLKRDMPHHARTPHLRGCFLHLLRSEFSMILRKHPSPPYVRLVRMSSSYTKNRFTESLPRRSRPLITLQTLFCSATKVLFLQHRLSWP